MSVYKSVAINKVGIKRVTGLQLRSVRDFSRNQRYATLH